VTGKIYLGALVNALLVAWMFASSRSLPIPFEGKMENPP